MSEGSERDGIKMRRTEFCVVSDDRLPKVVDR